MSSDEEFANMKRKLEEHEKRIRELENSFKSSKKKIVAKRKSIPEHLNYLKSEGFFDQPQTVEQIREELAKAGYHYPPQSFTYALQQVVRQRILGRIKKNRRWTYCKR